MKPWQARYIFTAIDKSVWWVERGKGARNWTVFASLNGEIIFEQHGGGLQWSIETILDKLSELNIKHLAKSEERDLDTWRFGYQIS